jgi:hypothetical protein
LRKAAQAFALDLGLPLPETVLGQNDGRRVDDDHPRLAINDDPVILFDNLAGRTGTDHGGNVHAARHDGGVRCLAPHIGHKPCEHALFELEHVGWRQVVRDQNERHVNGVIQQQTLRGFTAGRWWLHHR